MKLMQSVGAWGFAIRLEWQEPDEPRGSGPVLGGVGGEIPSVYSALHPDEPGVHVPGGGHGLAQPQSALLAGVKHHEG